MDLELLEDFLELARELNFSRTANNRNMTQPAFSRRIKILEEIMQTPLLIRTTRSVQLTPAGQTFQPLAAATLRLFQTAKKETLEAAGNFEKTINLAATHALSYSFIPKWLMQITVPEELGSLNMVSDSYHQCTKLLINGDANFFVCHKGNTSDLYISDKQFRHHIIGTDKLVALCAPNINGDALWNLDKPNIEFPLISYGPASALHQITKQHFQRQEIQQPANQIIVNKMSSILAATNMEMAKAGQGVSTLPLSLAKQELKNKTLVRANAEKNDIPIQIVIYRPKTRLSPHCENFWQKVKTQ